MGRPERGLELLKEIQAAGVAPTWRLEFTKARLMGSSSHEAVIEILDKALGMPEVKVDVVAPYLTAVLQAQLSGTELLERLKFWHQRTNHFLFLQTMAGTLAEMREYKRALELYEKVSAANPNFVEAPINASILQYRHLSAAEKAIGTLKKLLDHEQITRNPPMQNLVATHLGAAYAAKKDFANASEQFTKVLLKSDADPQVVDFIVRSFQSEGAHVQLLTLIQSLSGKVQGTGSMHALLGETLSEKLSRHTEGLQAYQNAITLEPDRSDLHTGLGLVYYRMHNYKDALRSFDSAAKLDPSDATAKYNQACVLSLMGRTDEALGSLQEALTLDPSLQQNAKADEDFKAIRELQPFRDILAQERNVGTTLDFGH
jgi:tetratricopeptide (TPR) repeat protein